MKATKIKFAVLIDVLSKDSISGLLTELATLIDQENANGMLSKDDGDKIQWSTKAKSIEIK